MSHGRAISHAGPRPMCTSGGSVLEHQDPLPALAVAEQHVRRAGALGREPVDHLAGGLGTQRRGQAFHGATLVAGAGYATAAGAPSCAYSG